MTVDRAARARRRSIFTGTSPQAADNFNAPGSVTKAAVLYVFRCLVDSEIPMNAGCLKPLDIVVPEGSFLKPRPPARWRRAMSRRRRRWSMRCSRRSACSARARGR
ncbi:MAG: hydantoinase B/oxoprolinase family protein [Rhizomicrobium sp.]